MDTIEKIMDEAHALNEGDKLTDQKVAELCLQKFQHMLDTGGMDFELGMCVCPACLKYNWHIRGPRCIKNDVKCMLSQAGYSCFNRKSPLQQLEDAQIANDQVTCTTQVQWFVDFFAQWLKDNRQH